MLKWIVSVAMLATILASTADAGMFGRGGGRGLFGRSGGYGSSGGYGGYTQTRSSWGNSCCCGVSQSNTNSPIDASDPTPDSNAAQEPQPMATEPTTADATREAAREERSYRLSRPAIPQPQQPQTQAPSPAKSE